MKRITLSLIAQRQKCAWNGNRNGRLQMQLKGLSNGTKHIMRVRICVNSH